MRPTAVLESHTVPHSCPTRTHSGPSKAKWYKPRRLISTSNRQLLKASYDSLSYDPHAASPQPRHSTLQPRRRCKLSWKEARKATSKPSGYPPQDVVQGAGRRWRCCGAPRLPASGKHGSLWGESRAANRAAGRAQKKNIV
ncbi:hypothetical protein BU26DRAFT_185895 [Trematosphaeria pertusa]|uniref:Uncharacterized protein n=1 Tax=Trematosphaeria pertusa TaxID=390896 RepID=A0A6A6HSB5_9PLEO|nr:uncharacterized protein BU26DRAFT_185895 [Trematosphaeria pertusa]KAF2241006.1 hypothetical protein BU26DRAFT_185895 [Trematosphaeria pertusa]